MFLADEGDLFRDWPLEYGLDIFPIGQYDLGRYFLGIGANAEVYLVESWVSSFGCVPEAMENLVLGVRPEDL